MSVSMGIGVLMLLVAALLTGWLLRGREVELLERHQQREDKKWSETLISAQQRYVALVGELGALTREFRDLMEKYSDLKYQLGTQRGQGRVGLLEDGPEEGWVLSDEHELEVQNERRAASEGSAVDSSVVNHLLAE